MDPKGTGTVQLELNATAAQLLASMCVQLETEDVAGVLNRALGLLDMALRTKRQGGRLVFENEHGEQSDVAF